jgi:predicted RNA binding protein YcfA (HicA-like mRNA interferase family)
VSYWPSAKARKVFAALKRIGWVEAAEVGSSHLTLKRDGWPSYTWAFHDGEEIGPRMLARIAKHTGLKPSDL